MIADSNDTKKHSWDSAERAPSDLNIAIVGTGVAGLGAAWLLSQRHRVTLYERNDYAGGHSNTVEISDHGRTTSVDTGFIVYNERNYPNLTALFRILRVDTQASSMSFAVSLEDGRLEYCGNGLAGMFAQRRNLASVSMWHMIADIIRFYRSARTAAGAFQDGVTIGEFLRRHHYSRAFANRHLMPMIAAIWSLPPQAAANIPLTALVAFFENHGLLQLQNRPSWRTVSGGSRQYVSRLIASMGRPVQVERAIEKIVRTADGVVLRDRLGVLHNHDGVIVATHADEALGLLAMPTAEEREILNRFRYHSNRTVLHSDPRLMPRRRKVWSSWNVLGAMDPDGPVGVTYWMNRLQRLSNATPLFVSLNPPKEPKSTLTHRTFSYDHPILDAGALSAQRQLDRIQGLGGVWYCGSYFGHGFHEDALRSGLEIAERFGIQRPWRTDGVLDIAELEGDPRLQTQAGVQGG